MVRDGSNVPATDRQYRFINSYTMALSRRDRKYWESLTSQGIRCPDGRPLALALQLAYPRAGFHQVRGPSFFRLSLAEGRSLGVRHLFVGATAPTLQSLALNASAEYPGVSIAGTIAPEFGPLGADTIEAIAALVKETKADILWLGLGTPRQDYELPLVAEQVDIPVLAVGAAFDFLAGTVSEAPHLATRLGLEWLVRLAREPRRLWRRYLIGNSVFLAMAVPAVVSARAAGRRRRRRSSRNA